MNTEPGFTPTFGPNGAVMNAPTMTPEMQAKFDRIGKLPSASAMLGPLSFLPFLFVIVVTGSLSGVLAASPWWAGLISGLGVAVGGWHVYRGALMAQRTWVEAPPRLRVPLTALDVAAHFTLAGYTVAACIELTIWRTAAIFLAIGVVVAAIGLTIRHLASRRAA